MHATRFKINPIIKAVWFSIKIIFVFLLDSHCISNIHISTASNIYSHYISNISNASNLDNHRISNIHTSIASNLYCQNNGYFKEFINTHIHKHAHTYVHIFQNMLFNIENYCYQNVFVPLCMSENIAIISVFISWNTVIIAVCISAYQNTFRSLTYTFPWMLSVVNKNMTLHIVTFRSFAMSKYTISVCLSICSF